jgi:hypothetical protein
MNIKGEKKKVKEKLQFPRYQNHLWEHPDAFSSVNSTNMTKDVPSASGMR